MASPLLHPKKSPEPLNMTTVGPCRGGADEKMLGEKALATIILLKGSNQQFCTVEITILDLLKTIQAYITTLL
jgi:hypothetical protein